MGNNTEKTVLIGKDKNGNGVTIRLTWGVIITVAFLILFNLLNFWMNWKNSNARVISEVKTEVKEMRIATNLDIKTSNLKNVEQDILLAKYSVKLDNINEKLDEIKELIKNK